MNLMFKYGDFQVFLLKMWQNQKASKRNIETILFLKITYMQILHKTI